LSVGFGSDSGMQKPSAAGFNNLNPYSYTNVVDPNGASADIDINLAQVYGTLAAGQSRSVVWLVVFGNSKAEVTNAYVNLGLPPTVDHFNWNTIPSSKSNGVPFGVTITAQDVWGRNFTNFAGPVVLSASAGGRGVTNRMMEGLPPSASGSGTYTAGYHFTPTNNLTVTHVSSYFGTKVSLWTGSGVLLATQLVTSPSGVWSETALSAPVSLTAGSDYVVAAYVSANTYYWLTSLSGAFVDGTIGTSVFAAGDAFPTGSAPGAWLLVGLRYTVGVGQALALAQTTSGIFVTGAWAGNLTVLQPATNVVLYANDGSGHFGSSNPFQVVSNAAAYAMLTVNTNGSGTVDPNYTGAWLPVGQPYSLMATPGAGYVFFRWTGSLTTNSSMLNFVMAPNLAFTANFANQTNPPVGIKSGSSSQLVIFWPAGVTNYVMQTNGDLGTTNWGNYDPAMITTNGTAEQIIVNPTNGNLYFRLKQ
jgi:hypothetical protein